METQYISLNMTPSGVNPIFHISQYDVGRLLGFYVYNGSEVVDLDDYTCTVEATRTDGTQITTNVITNNNSGIFAVTATMSNVADKYNCQLVIVDRNTNRVASLPFIMDVVTAALNGNDSSIYDDRSLYQQYNAAMQAASANEANIRENADNVLQANISAESSARSTQDAFLQSQINNIIAPSGEAPSAAEVQNARIGADGVTYDTLGTAIRTQVNNLNDEKADKTDLETERKRIDVLNDGGLILKDDVIAKDITDWLDEHPEATTTVQDGSIKEEKINASFLPWIKNDYVTPEMFGAKADGLTDCTNAFKKMLNKDNTIILCKAGTYLIKDTIVVSANNVVIFGDNTVIKNENGTSSDVLHNVGFITFSNCAGLYLQGLTFDNDASVVKRVNYGTSGYDEYISSRNRAYIPLKLENVEKFNIENCTFTHGSAGLYVAGSKIGSIANCISCDNHADGYFITGASRNITVSNCKSIRNDDDSFSADGYGDESKSPANIEFVNCIADNCFGALCCLYGSNYTKVLNCIGYNLRYLPFKTGLLKVGDTYLGTSGSNQTIANCTAYISQAPDGDGSKYMEGVKYPCGSLIDGDSNNFVSNISISNCKIINKSNIPFVLLMKYATNVNFSNNRLDGFAIKSKFINVFNFENNQMDLVASLFFDTCSYLTVVGNKVSSTNIFNFGIDNKNCWCTECADVVLVGNNFGNKVSFYSGGNKSGFKTDENQNPGFVAKQTNIQVLGILFTDNWLSGANYVKGQMVLKPDGTLMISDGKSFRNIALTN